MSKADREAKRVEREIRQVTERVLLEKAIKRHEGILSKVAAEWPKPITRQGICRKVSQYAMWDLVKKDREKHQPTIPGIEPEMILQAIDTTPNFKAAADMLGVSRRTLYRRMYKLGFKKPPSK